MSKLIITSDDKPNVQQNDSSTNDQDRDRAGRRWRDHVIVWRDRMGALLANLTTCHSMKSATFETTPAETGKSHSGLVRDLVELVKARLTLLVLLTTAVGFYLGAEGPINFVALLHTVFGTAAAAAGAAALNQWWEYNLDALMQ